MPLSEAEISTRLKSLPDWKVESGELTRTFSFKDFVGSLAFVNDVGELAEKAGIPIRETTLTRHDIYVADECFLTGTAAEVIAVVKCDARVIGTGKPGPITRQLREAFQVLLRS